MKNQGSSDVPDSFVAAIRKRRAEVGISLRRLAFQADMDPATLSRILSKQQNLPANEVILRLAEVLEIQPPEVLLVEAGRVPGNKPQMTPLLRAASELTERELNQVLRVARDLARKRAKKKKGGK
ncbi:MAG: helix-turn-helix domain-containing protein [Planctomycetota bacterium]